MPKNKCIGISFLVFFLLCNVSSFAQSEEKIPLVKYLNTIEAKFNIQFSYNVANVQHKNIEAKTFDALATYISYLEQDTNLLFEKVSERYIAIYPQQIKRIVDLPEVVVTNYMVKGLQQKLNGSFVLSTTETSLIPGITEPDVLQTAQIIPGIESSNETISNINIRGGTNDQNLIIWNGIRMYHTGHFFGLVSAFNPYVTNKVSIIKNATPSYYGNAVSGVITMESQFNDTQIATGSLGMNMLSADANITLPIGKKLTIQASGRRSIADVFTSPIVDAYMERTINNASFDNDNSTTSSNNLIFYDATLNATYQHNKKHKLVAHSIFSFDDLLFTTQFENDIENRQLKQLSLGGHIGLESNWSSKLSTVAEATFSYYEVDADTYQNTQNTLVQENLVEENTAHLGFSYKPTKGLLLQGGYQFYETGITNYVNVFEPEYFRTSKEVMLSHALYSDASYQFNSFFIRGGLRAQHYNKLSTIVIEPRVQLTSFITPHFSASVKGEIKSQSVTQIIDLHEDFFGLSNRRWMLTTSEAIPLNKSKQASFELSFKPKHWTFSATAFIKDVEGITTKTQGFQNQNEFTTASGSYVVKGLEFLIHKESTHFNGWLSYTLNDNTYNFPTLTPPEFPNNFNVKHSLDGAISYKHDKFEIGIGFKYKSGTPYTKPQEGNEINYNQIPNTINYNKPNSATLKNYVRTDASARFTIFENGNTKGILSIALLNIFDRDNVLNTYYEIDQDEQQVKEINNFGLGFSPNASLRFLF